MEQSPTKRSSLAPAFLVVLAIAGSGVGVLIYQSTQKENPPPNTAGFDLSQTTARRDASSGQPGQGLPAAPTDSTDMSRQAPPSMPQTGSLYNAGPAGGGAEAERLSEKEFLAKHDAEIRQYQKQLDELTARYYQKHAVVREVDAAFGGMERYMAVKRRYEADRDLYKWARDVAALPEVRTVIRKYAARPDVWPVAVDMMIETLKMKPPSPEVYKEITRVMTQDPTLMDFTGKVAQDIQPNLTVGVMALAGKDLTPLNKVIKDLSLDKKQSP